MWAEGDDEEDDWGGDCIAPVKGQKDPLSSPPLFPSGTVTFTSMKDGYFYSHLERS